ncbi:MAG: hypothetical protein ACYC27_02995 [Armatimonadota bacterium]
MSEFISYSYPVARKTNKCHKCHMTIFKGEQYEKAVGKNEGGFWYIAHCMSHKWGPGPEGKREPIIDLQAICDDWNAKHPVGMEVTLRKDDDSLLHTRTRSIAQVLSGHTAVIKVDGKAGYWLLDRVSPIKAPGEGLE